MFFKPLKPQEGTSNGLFQLSPVSHSGQWPNAEALLVLSFPLLHPLFLIMGSHPGAFGLQWRLSVLLNPLVKQHCYLWSEASGREVRAWGPGQAAACPLQRTHLATAFPGRTSAWGAQQKSIELYCSSCRWPWCCRSLVQRVAEA